MNVVVERLSRKDCSKTNISFDTFKDELTTATTVANSGTFEKPAVDMGDVILVRDRIFLVEADLSLTELEQDEYAYYKNIPSKDRVAQWFGVAIN